MESIISKIYIITTDEKKFEKIKYRLNTDKIKIVKCNPLLPKNLEENTIKDITTPSCSHFCSNKTIITWMSHYNLWKNIAKRKESNVLIIEDTGIPAKNFSSLFEEYWKEVPKNWDMLYLGCVGSCDSSIIKDATYKITQSRSNGDVYKDGKKMFFVMEPGFPLGLYGYMLSQTGVQKLVNNQIFKKVKYDIDYLIAKDILDDGDFTVYAFKPSLITYHPHKKRVTNHEIFKPFTSQMKISNKQSINSLWNTPALYIRKLGVEISYFSLFIIILSFIIGYKTNDKVRKLYLSTASFLQIFEIAFTKTNKLKIKNLFFELFLIHISYFMGLYLQNRKK